MLDVRNISVDQLLALERLPRDGAFASYIAGSAIDGLGNAWSDIDLYVIGDCAPVGDFVIDNGNHHVSIHYLDSQRVDFEFWKPGHIKELAAKLDGFVDDKLGDEVPLSIAEQQFVHRLLHNSPCFGNVETWARTFDIKQLSRMQMSACVRQTDSLHEDICGMLESGDYASAALLCRPLLENALGASLHASGNTIPTAKWRFQIAAKMQPKIDCLDMWWELQFPSLPRQEDTASLLKHIVDCIRLSEQLVVTAQT